MALETQTGDLFQSRGVGWGGKWEGGSKRRRYMYTYGWFMLRFWQKTTKFCKAIIFQLKKKKTEWDKARQKEASPFWRGFEKRPESRKTQGLGRGAGRDPAVLMDRSWGKKRWSGVESEALFRLALEDYLRFLSATLVRWITAVEDWRQKDQLGIWGSYTKQRLKHLKRT